jgi:hypothetical protein
MEGHLDPLRMYRLLFVDCNKLSPARTDSTEGSLLEAKLGQQTFFGRQSIFFEVILKVVAVIVDSCSSVWLRPLFSFLKNLFVGEDGRP